MESQRRSNKALWAGLAACAVSNVVLLLAMVLLYQQGGPHAGAPGRAPVGDAAGTAASSSPPSFAAEAGRMGRKLHQEVSG